jgi:hypothetical protein
MSALVMSAAAFAILPRVPNSGIEGGEDEQDCDSCDKIKRVLARTTRRCFSPIA